MSTKPTADKDSVQFGRIPYEIIAGGLVRKMTASDAKLYVIIAAHCNAKWRCHLSLDRLVSLSGLSRTPVIAATKRLEEIGAIAIHPGGGRGKASQFWIETNSQASSTVSPAEQSSSADCLGGQKGQVSGTKQARSGTETGEIRDRNSQASSTPTENNRVEQQQQAGAAHAAAAAAAGSGEGEESEVIAALRLAGIHDPKRSELAAMPGLTAEIVCAEATKLANTNKGTGILVQNLESAAIKAANDKVERDFEESQREERCDARESERREVSERRDSDVKLLKLLTPDQLAALRTEVVQNAPPVLVRVWHDANPFTAVMLRTKMADLLRSKDDGAIVSGDSTDG